MLTILGRYGKNGVAFLSVYLAAQMFGPSLWHFVAASVQHWWHGGATRDILSGLGGMIAFLWFSEYRRREKAARSVPAAARRQRTGPWA